MYYLLIIILIILICIGIIYNLLVKQKNKVDQAESNIDVYLNQRFDLIPNLLECVKEYSKYESEVLEKITTLRSDYMNNKNNLQTKSNLNKDFNNILGTIENYPELKASEQFLNLQRNLSKMESQLQAARRIYNNEATLYNTKIAVFPLNIVAGLFGFKRKLLFEIEQGKEENINVDI